VSGHGFEMSPDSAAVRNVRNLFDRAVQTLATSTESIQEHLADACVFSFIGDEPNVFRGLPEDVYLLQRELQVALSAVHDSEGGWTKASSAQLTDEQCADFARRIVEASRSIHEFCGQQPYGSSVLPTSLEAGSSSGGDCLVSRRQQHCDTSPGLSCHRGTAAKCAVRPP
jgi:hypothetical protein